MIIETITNRADRINYFMQADEIIKIRSQS